MKKDETPRLHHKKKTGVLYIGETKQLKTRIYQHKT